MRYLRGKASVPWANAAKPLRGLSPSATQRETLRSTPLRALCVRPHTHSD
ncbi:MAG: hypothetical protein HDS38_00525 [Bacteroides sp.]|nr:hypothetical protein [Bacteroides sp.]